MGNKGSQWGNQLPPPKGQMVSVQSPPDPSPALALPDRAARALGETGHPSKLTIHTAPPQCVLTQHCAPSLTSKLYFSEGTLSLSGCTIPAKKLKQNVNNLQLMRSIKDQAFTTIYQLIHTFCSQKCWRRCITEVNLNCLAKILLNNDTNEWQQLHSAVT